MTSINYNNKEMNYKNKIINVPFKMRAYRNKYKLRRQVQ